MARAWPQPGRLSPGALGLSLVLLVSVAWGTGLFYLVVRLGAGSPVRLASIDGIHAYVGLVGGVFVVAKVVRVGLRHRVEGVPNVVPWQRWLSWSMLVLYGAVFVSGVLVLLPLRGQVYTDLVDLHLLTSVWALVPTTWHVWHYRARALPYVRRWTSRLSGRRFWMGAALLLVPVPALLADAPAVSQLPGVLGGAAWSPVGALRGSYLDTIARAQDGTLVAAGDALYVSRDGIVWLRVDLPVTSPTAATPPPSGGSDQHAGHQHGQPAPANAISALALSGSQILVGTPQGLFTSGFSGPLQPVALPGRGAVRSLAVDPANPDALWAASAAGPLASADGGRTWARQPAGLAKPAAAAAVAYLGGDVFVSDMTAVYRWVPSSSSWTRTLAMPSVTSLSAQGSRLYAASLTDLRVLDGGGGWTDLGQPAPIHFHHGHEHGQTPDVASVDGRLYAAGTSDGVSASADGGWTWTQLGGGLGGTTPNEVIGSQGHLLAATADGLYEYPLTASRGATPQWWMGVLAAALVLGLVAVGVGTLDPRRRRPRSTG